MKKIEPRIFNVKEIEEVEKNETSEPEKSPEVSIKLLRDKESLIYKFKSPNQR